MTGRSAITRRNSRASLGPVKPLRFAPTPSGLAGLTGPPGRHVLGNCVMAHLWIARFAIRLWERRFP